MRGIKYNKIVNKLNIILKNISEGKNILEIGCGSKIYKDIFYQHNYYGLDKHKSEWVFNDDLPEFYCDIKNFNTDLKFDLIFSIATVYLFDEDSLLKFIELIKGLENTRGRCIIFDYRKKTIFKLGNNYNFYLEKLNKNFSKYMSIDENYEWCSNNFMKNQIKKMFRGKINKSIIIDINFNL